VFANDLLQGEVRRAGTTAGRFLVNSTVGLAGLLDLAARRGMTEQTGDFGQTLYVWGLPEGPYLMLPLFGPSNPRDGIGTGVDIISDPWIYLTSQIQYQTTIAISRAVLGGIAVGTCSTLLFVPFLYAVLRRGEVRPLEDYV